jgi:catechol 2,3-dioxygenase-like lactoylglutathione lyase family enzyme
MPHVLVAIVVHEYDPAIRFFVDVLGFELVEDAPGVTTDGRPKRWVVVRPPGAQTGILLARADYVSCTSAAGRDFRYSAKMSLKRAPGRRSRSRSTMSGPLIPR